MSDEVILKNSVRCKPWERGYRVVNLVSHYFILALSSRILYLKYSEKEKWREVFDLKVHSPNGRNC